MARTMTKFITLLLAIFEDRIESGRDWQFRIKDEHAELKCLNSEEEEIVGLKSIYAKWQPEPISGRLGPDKNEGLHE